MRKFILRHVFWISLLLHLCLFLSFVVVWNFSIPYKSEPKPSMYVPAYVYHPQTNPTLTPTTAAIDKQVPTSKMGIEKPTSSRQTMNAQPPAKTNSSKNTEAIHLIGTSKDVKPLIKLLGKALAARLVYPKIAYDFNLKGTSIVGFVLHPDGRITNVHLVKSSGADILDDAALKGVNAISPVRDVNLYLHEAKPLVVGIIFA